ncbi:MAG: outer membrane beta-barrel protein [Bacteroidales bacterium]|nr:outer membrane beta-barrel protein [Bacteroidales bacterium]
MRKHGAIVLLLLASLTATAQRTDLLSRSELVLTGGGMNYLGDLNDQSAFGEVHAGFGAGVRCRLDNRWSLRLGGSYGTVSASEDWQEWRNLSFRSRIYEGSLLAEFNFRPFGPGATESQWTPYIFGGVAVFHFGPEALYEAPDGSTSWVALQPLCTEGQGTTTYPSRRSYPLTQLAMPFGVGVRWRLSKNFSLTAEYGFRKTWTDYLDDVSTTYVGADLLTAEYGNQSAALADRSDMPNAVGIKRGDDSLDDWYSYFNLSVGLNLNMLFGWMRSKRCRN